MRLITWNVNRRTTRLGEQLEALLARQPDVVALQEVTTGNVSGWRDGLQHGGLPYIVDTVEQTQPPSRPYAVLTASRWPFITPPLTMIDILWPERIACVTLESPWGAIELHNVYTPTGGSRFGGEPKMQVLEAIFKQLARPVDHHRLLCGDFNTPLAETTAGQLITFGQRIKANGEVVIRRKVMGIAGERWDAAERNILETLAAFDLADSYRAVNGYANVEDFSWFHKARGKLTGFRLDHIFASTSLKPSVCHYLYGVRTEGLSDHAPLEAWFSPVKRI